MENTINEKIENIDVSDVEKITLIPNDSKKIIIKTQNFYKIIKLIIKKSGKIKFLPGELDEIYKYMIENYKTQIDEKTYEKVKNALNIFVENGGRIEIKYLD